jgi:transposase-like protein
LIAAIAESYLQGVSTRRVQDISQELGEKVDEFLKRPIEHPIPYLYVDARAISRSAMARSM